MNENVRHMRNSRQAMLVASGVGELTFLVIGAGGIGSHAAHLLASIGAEHITVFDPDVVGEENVWPQFYNANQVGMPKVHALADNIFNSTGTYINPVQEKYRDQVKDVNVVVTGLDSMYERFVIWKRARASTRFDLWVDGRMGGMGCCAYWLDKGDTQTIDIYDKYEVNPDVVSELACGEKATAFITNYLAGIMVAGINSWMRGEPYPALYHSDFEGGLWRTAPIRLTEEDDAILSSEGNIPA